MTPSFAIRIGNQTAAFAPSLGVPFEFAVSQGFRAFEWFPDKTWTEADLEAPVRRDIRDVARKNDIRLSVHSPLGMDPLQPEESTPSEPALALARDLGATVFNIHLQTERGAEAFLRALEPLIRQTADENVVLALENTPLTGPEDFNRFFKLLRTRPDLPAEHVGVCFDLGHANLCAATRNDYLGFLDRLSPEVPVVHLHLHENYGDHDAHLPLFTGPAGEDDGGIRGLLERLRTRGFNGSAIMEVWPDPPERLTETRDRLQSLMAELEPDPANERSSPPAPGEAFPSDPFTARIVEYDRRARSWREKLQGVESLLAETERAPAPESLAALAVYLRWLHTGRIPCREDSRHFRPHHHAKTSAAIEAHLAAWKNDDNALLLRRIHVSLPSYDTPFTRAEPLTRIRDIAHRNDIPHDLKQEIKHTLQNKLHRCAGPEDLKTSEGLLTRIREGDYSADFVAEFKAFHRELQAFFNTQSLNDRLAPLKEELTRDARRALKDFLETSGANDEEVSVKCFRIRALTTLRGFLTAGAEEREGHAAQAFRLAEIGLETFAFPVLSDLINELEKQKTFPWMKALETMSLTLRHFEMSGAWTDECRAIRHEIDALRDGFRIGDRCAALRLKASLDRVRRLCDTIADRVIELFRKAAGALGRALAVPESDITHFCEAELRRDLVFQLAKLNTLLRERSRNAVGETACEPLAPGTGRGILTPVDGLETVEDDSGRPIIALLQRATGDEDIPARAAGLILLQPVPHLSHLAVRARQAGIPFVHCEPGDETDRLRQAGGRRISLEVSADGFSWEFDNEKTEGASPPPGAQAARKTTNAALDFAADPVVMPLDRVTPERAGQKAAALRGLSDLADTIRDFTVPPALVIPFGVLEHALRDATKDRLDRINGVDEETLGRELKALRATVRDLPVPEKILRKAASTFAADAALIARSSASAEDGTVGAGAGIYHSIPNLTPDLLADGIRAVWASLWTLKAFHNRRRSGLDPVRCGMAVILQPLVTPDLAFILHSAHPITADPDEVYIEAAPGLGATLADAAEPGAPYRFTVRAADTVTTLAFCSFSRLLRPGAPGTLEKHIADYSSFPLTHDRDHRESTARRLAAVAKKIEAALKAPQDIEGFILDDRIHLVQSRPQQVPGWNDAK